ncbi:unnamed protein product [Hymenolepis diminuta]|nr:unnamed protein product [Hymenolepis diminuta]
MANSRLDLFPLLAALILLVANASAYYCYHCHHYYDDGGLWKWRPFWDDYYYERSSPYITYVNQLQPYNNYNGNCCFYCQSYSTHYWYPCCKKSQRHYRKTSSKRKRKSGKRRHETYDLNDPLIPCWTESFRDCIMACKNDYVCIDYCSFRFGRNPTLPGRNVTKIKSWDYPYLIYVNGTWHLSGMKSSQQHRFSTPKFSIIYFQVEVFHSPPFSI